MNNINKKDWQPIKKDWNYNGYKELEKLFAWAYFYRVNKLDKKYAQTQIEIENLRKTLFKN